jgi:hypothetical protein
VIINWARLKTAPFPLRWKAVRNLEWRITALKLVKNGHRFSPFTAGIRPSYSSFRPYKSPFPTVGTIALGRWLSFGWFRVSDSVAQIEVKEFKAWLYGNLLNRRRWRNEVRLVVFILYSFFSLPLAFLEFFTFNKRLLKWWSEQANKATRRVRVSYI